MSDELRAGLMLAAMIINCTAILLFVGYWIVRPVLSWIWTRYFWPPIECPRMLAERRKP